RPSARKQSPPARPGWSALIPTACTPRSTSCSLARGPIRRWPMPSTPTATAAPRSGRQKPSNTCSTLVIGQFPLAAAPTPEHDPHGGSPVGPTVQLLLPFAPKPETGGPRQLPACFDLAT